MGVQWGGRFELTVASSSIATVTVHCGTSVQYRTIGTVQVCYTFDALPMAQQGMIIVAVVLAFETEACVSWRQSWSWPTSGLITLITSQTLASHSHPPVLRSLSLSGVHSASCWIAFLGCIRLRAPHCHQEFLSSHLDLKSKLAANLAVPKLLSSNMAHSLFPDWRKVHLNSCFVVVQWYDKNSSLWGS